MIATALPFLCLLLPADPALQDTARQGSAGQGSAGQGVVVLDDEPQDARTESRVPS